MLRIDLSLDAPSLNLALDEALLHLAEFEGGQFLRFWRFNQNVVILGRGSKLKEEVDESFCTEAGIPILRRCSGGATIVGGPGCLMYSLILSTVLEPAFRNIDLVHRFVMNNLLKAIANQRPEIQWQGTCDLTIDNRKFSGNSLKVSKSHLLYHGTLLLDTDLELIGRCLKTPPRQPSYRLARPHRDFITNLPIDPSKLCDTLAESLGVTDIVRRWPEAQARELSEAKYSTEAWLRRH